MSYRSQQTYIKNPHIFNLSNQQPKLQNYHSQQSYGTLQPQTYYQPNISPQYANFPQPHDLQVSINPQKFSNIAPLNYNQINKSLLIQTNNQIVNKEIQKINYRKELQIQMKADKQRKQKQKQQLDRYQLQREQKFYQNVQNQNHQNKNDKNQYHQRNLIKGKKPQKQKQKPHYFVIRSSQNKRKKHHQLSQNNNNNQISNDNNQISNSYIKQNNMMQNNYISPIDNPKIIKRGGYNNKSSLDKFQISNNQSILNPQTTNNINRSRINNNSQIQQTQQALPLKMIDQKNYQLQRINNITKLQQKMLRKLDNVKNQIYQQQKYLDVDAEVQKIRLKLRSCSVKLDNIISIRDNQIFQNRKDFFHLPTIPLNLSRSRNLNRQLNNRQLNHQLNSQQNNRQYNNQSDNQQNNSQLNDQLNSQSSRRQSNSRQFNNQDNISNQQQNEISQIRQG